MFFGQIDYKAVTAFHLAAVKCLICNVQKFFIRTFIFWIARNSHCNCNAKAFYIGKKTFIYGKKQIMTFFPYIFIRNNLWKNQYEFIATETSYNAVKIGNKLRKSAGNFL